MKPWNLMWRRMYSRRGRCSRPTGIIAFWK
jgi:hypothetical protein